MVTDQEIDDFEERAAILEFCSRMSRFEAETKAAIMQGKKRWELIDEIRQRNT